MGGLFNGTCCGYHNGRGHAESGPEALRRDYMRAKWVYCAALLLTGVASWLARDFAPKALLALPDTFDYCAIPTDAANVVSATSALPPPPAPENGTAAVVEPSRRRRQRALLAADEAAALAAPPAAPAAEAPPPLGPLASLTGLLAAALPQGLAGLLPGSSSSNGAEAGPGANATAEAAVAVAAAAAPPPSSSPTPAPDALPFLQNETTTTNATTPSETLPTRIAKHLTSATSERNLAKQRLVAALSPGARRRLEACVGRQAAVRVSFASAAFFLLHAAAMVACTRERDLRAGLHSSLMAPRLLLWLGAIVGALFLPQQAAAAYAQAARAGAALFLVFAMVECVHSFYDANRWLLDKQAWWAWMLLVLGAVLALGGGFAAIGAAFWYYAPADQGAACRLNTLFCALSVVAGALMVLVLFVPGRRPEAGLLTSGAVLLYGTWLLFSALSTEPRGVGVGGVAEGASAAAASAAPLRADLCVPRLGGVSDRATVIAGFFVGIAAVCYSTLNVGTSSVWRGRPTAEEEQPGGGGGEAGAFAAAAPYSPPPAVVMLGNDASFSVARAGGAHGGGGGLASFTTADGVAGYYGGGGEEENGGGRRNGRNGNNQGSSSPSILGSRPRSGGGPGGASPAPRACDGAAAVYIIQQQGNDGGKCATPVPAPAAAALLRRLGQRNGGEEEDDDRALPPIASGGPVLFEVAPPSRLGRRLAYRPDMFHLVYALAAMYLAMLFTNWEVAAVVIASDGAGGGGGGAASGAGAGAASLAAFQFGGGWASVWVKMATKWFCEALYLWSVLAPVLCGRWREFA